MDGQLHAVRQGRNGLLAESPKACALDASKNRPRLRGSQVRAVSLSLEADQGCGQCPPVAKEDELRPSHVDNTLLQRRNGSLAESPKALHFYASKNRPYLRTYLRTTCVPRNTYRRRMLRNFLSTFFIPSSLTSKELLQRKPTSDGSHRHACEQKPYSNLMKEEFILNNW